MEDKLMSVLETAVKNPANYTPEWSVKTREGYNGIFFKCTITGISVNVIYVETQSKVRRTKKALLRLANSKEVQDQLKKHLDKIVLKRDEGPLLNTNIAKNYDTPIEVLCTLAGVYDAYV